MTDAARQDRRATLAIAGIIAAGVLLRLVVLRAQGFPSDVGTFQAWAERMAQVGPGSFYDPSVFSDYPPAYLYVLWLLGALFDGEFLRLAVKATSIAADVAIAAGAAMLVWRYSGRANAMVAASLWSLAPGPIFAGPYWGQIDSVGSLPLFAALAAAGRGRWWTAGVLAAIAAMIKPQFGIGLIVIAAAAVVEWIRDGRWRPAADTTLFAAATILVLGAPFHSGPGELIGLVRGASETYPYTSLYAFNVWSVVGDFWKPDDAFVVQGAVLLVAGLLASCVPLWRGRDTATLLAAGTLAAFAFYFLPTRAHERYLFPAFVLLLPLAATRARLLWPYVALSLTFAVTLYFAFTRYPQNDLRAPPWLDDTLFSRNGQIALALLLMAIAGLVAWRLARGEARLEPSLEVAAIPGPSEAPRGWRLPPGLTPGTPPTRRDVVVAFLVALLVLVTRGYRLDQPRDMYFDEVYHARTAFELLAQRDPYEWTHPHLAKEIMALGILAFGSDRVVGREPLPRQGVAQFAALSDGRRVYLSDERPVSVLSVVERDGRRRDIAKGIDARAMTATPSAVWLVTDRELVAVPYEEPPANAKLPTAAIPFQGPPTSLVAVGDRIVVGAAAGLAIYAGIDAPPITSALSVVALTAKPDGTELYLLDPRGDVHVLDPNTGKETRSFPGGGEGRAIAYAQGPGRIFVARSGEPSLDVFDATNGQRESVRLSNGRTGSFASGVTALALVPRTQFLYALADGRVVVIEPHGASPFAAIPTNGTFLAVDGEDDKLLVAGADGVDRIETGRHSLAWRLPGVLFAAMLAFFVVLLARRLFAAPLVAWLAGAAIVLDGSMFAQARIGMNDIYVAALIVAGWYFVVAAHRPRRSAAVDLLIAGALFGLAIASKWAGVYALGGVFVLSVAQTALAFERGNAGARGPLDLLRGRGASAAFLFSAFAVVPFAIYLAAYRPWFGGPTAPYGWNLWELTQQMYWYHSSLTAPHCAGAPWWSWPLDLKPTYWYFGQSAETANGYIYDAGNLALFWLALPASGLVVALALRSRSWSLGLVSLAMLAQFVAWIPISRVLFFYHFFTALPFYLLCLAVVLALAWERSRTVVISYLGVVAAVFVIFYPYVSGLPIPGELASVYNALIPTWQYDPAFYPTDSCPTPVASSAATALTVGVAWLYELAVIGAAVAIVAGAPAARRALARLGLL